MSLRFALIACLVSLWCRATAHSAAEPSSNRIAPPAGIAIADADRKSPEDGVANPGPQTAFPSAQCVPEFIHPRPLSPESDGPCRGQQGLHVLPGRIGQQRAAGVEMTSEATGRSEDRIPFAGFFGEKREVLTP
jgi:hypothetical protein